MVALKNYVQKVEGYCRDAKASDESITTLQNSISEYKQILSEFDTTDIRLATDQSASDEEKKMTITNFLNSLKIESWTQRHLNNSSPT